MEYSHLHARHARIILIEAGPQLLPVFRTSLAEKARRSLERLGVEVWVGSPVGQCDAEGIAPAAKQEGAYVARLLIRRLTGKQSPAAFRYLIWGGIHIFFLNGFRNRMIVALGWLWSYFTSERGARLIIGIGGEL